MVSDFLSALILAVIQGVTEWFPVSSSGHIVLFEGILGYQGGLQFNVAVHFGTLMAVFVYFGKEITDIFRDFLSARWNTEEGRLAWLIIVASVPAGILGFLARDFFESTFSDLRVVVFGFGITGLFLLISSIDTTSFRKRSSMSQEKHMSLKEMGYGKAFLVGIAQALAIVPGISRSGATISSGLLFGLSEKAAMKFSFLMAIPIIFGANIFVIGNNTLSSDLIWATLVAFVVGLLAIHVVFKYVLTKRKNLRWFGFYCILLAIALGMWVFVV